MSDISNAAEGAVKGHIGKFPIWLVALLIVGGLGIFWYFYSRSAGAAGAAATPVTDTTGISTDGLPAATDTSSGDTTTSAPDNSLTATNQAWLSRAAAGVSMAFGTSQTTVYGVLYNYVNGLDWKQSQQKYIDRALADYGTPPEGTSGLGSATPDPVASKPVTTPVKAPTPAPKPPVKTPAPVTKPPVVVVKNPPPKPPVAVKPPVHKAPVPAPKPPVKKAPKPAPVNVATAPIGAKVTLTRRYSGYVTATAANAGGKATVTTGTGTYYVFNRAARSHGEMVNVTRVKGVPGAWINP